MDRRFAEIRAPLPSLGQTSNLAVGRLVASSFAVSHSATISAAIAGLLLQVCYCESAIAGLLLQVCVVERRQPWSVDSRAARTMHARNYQRIALGGALLFVLLGEFACNQLASPLVVFNTAHNTTDQFHLSPLISRVRKLATSTNNRVVIADNRPRLFRRFALHERRGRSFSHIVLSHRPRKKSLALALALSLSFSASLSFTS